MFWQRNDIDAIYLTEKELQKLEKLTLSDQFEICRDAFLIGYETGLRFGDFCCINSQQIKDGVLDVRPKKNEKKKNCCKSFAIIRSQLLTFCSKLRVANGIKGIN